MNLYVISTHVIKTNSIIIKVFTQSKFDLIPIKL